MQIERILNFEMNQNCYLVFDEVTKKAFVVDPGADAEKIIKKATELGVTISYILLTHCHYDHVGGLMDLKRKTGAHVCGSLNCNINIQNVKTNVSYGFGEPVSYEILDVVFADGDVLEFGGMTIDCILTPGHTNGSMCYLVEDHLFSGDTLFLRNVGRWDLPTGDENQLFSSIKNKLYTLDDSIIVHPGHGNDTQIGYEKKFNLCVKA